MATEPRARLEFDARRAVPEHAHAPRAFPEVVPKAEQAIRAEGIEPVRNPIRGGTDGSMLSAKGLPTPNIFAGGHEFHSRARVGIRAGHGGCRGGPRAPRTALDRVLAGLLRRVDVVAGDPAVGGRGRLGAIVDGDHGEAGEAGEPVPSRQA